MTMVTFTEEILNGKLHFLSSDDISLLQSIRFQFWRWWNIHFSKKKIKSPQDLNTYVCFILNYKSIQRCTFKNNLLLTLFEDENCNIDMDSLNSRIDRWKGASIILTEVIIFSWCHCFYLLLPSLLNLGLQSTRWNIAYQWGMISRKTY